MKRILLVEDDPNAAKAVAARLGVDGDEVAIAHSAWDALRVASGEHFDLFILDIGLPDDSGLNLATQLLSIPGAQATPILFLTGTGDFPTRLKASGIGVCAWLDKPYRPDQLRAVVAAALQDPAWARQAARQLSPLSPMLPHGSKTNRLLVIEDDKRLALALRRRFENAGYEVLTAHNGCEGLQSALQNRPNLIVSDIYMPGGLGFTLLEYLAQHNLREIPVIFLTASRRPNLRDTAFHYGAADFLEKPCDPAELLRAVRRAIAHRN